MDAALAEVCEFFCTLRARGFGLGRGFFLSNAPSCTFEGDIRVAEESTCVGITACTISVDLALAFDEFPFVPDGFLLFEGIVCDIIWQSLSLIESEVELAKAAVVGRQHSSCYRY